MIVIGNPFVIMEFWYLYKLRVQLANSLFNLHIDYKVLLI